VATDWSGVFVFTVLFNINTIMLIAAVLLSRIKNTASIPDWLINVVALSSVTYATIGIVVGIFDQYQSALPLLIVIASICFALGVWEGIRMKSGFYLTIIPFSLIVIVSALLIKISEGELMFLLVSLFIIGSVSLLIKNLVDIHKKWANEK
jgi:hypothetical protein